LETTVVSESPNTVQAFLATLPRDYRERFSPAQTAAHALAAERRRKRGAMAEAALFPWPDPLLTGLCVVADDRPGLLSKISRAIAELGYDVDSALAFTRTLPTGQAEAVDLFFVRDPNGALSAEDLTHFLELLDDHLREPEGTPSIAPELGPVAGGTQTTVRFLEDSKGALSVLEVETDDRSGLLWALTRALYREHVQIVGSKISTVGGRVHDRFVITELNGSPIGADRRFVIQVAVLTALGG
jgi:UTP:GlnB (protein PII) uridylyltransferase